MKKTKTSLQCQECGYLNSNQIILGWKRKRTLLKKTPGEGKTPYVTYAEIPHTRFVSPIIPYAMIKRRDLDSYQPT